MLMLPCSAFTAVVLDVSGGEFVCNVADMTRGQVVVGAVETGNFTVGGEEPTEQQKTLLSELLQEIALNSSITGDIANLDSEENVNSILDALKDAGVAGDDATEEDIISVPYLKVELKDVRLEDDNSASKLTFKVSPTVNHKGTEVKVSSFAKALTFRLPVPSGWTGAMMARHEGKPMGAYNVKVGANGSKYVELKSAEFSEFAIETNLVEVSTLDELHNALASPDNNPVLITQTIEIPKGMQTMIDLMGKDVTVPEADPETGKHIYAINNKGNLTIKNIYDVGSISARGIFNGYNGTNSDEKVDGAYLVIEGGTFYALDSDGGASLLNCAEVEIKGGTFEGVVAAVDSRASAETTISNGTFRSSNGGYAIQQNGGGTLTINDATVDGGFGAVGAYGGSVTINDGTFLPTGREGSKCHVVYVASGANVEINDGTFKMNYPENGTPESGEAVASYDKGTVDICGGTFYAHFDETSPVQLSEGAAIRGGKFLDHSGNPIRHTWITNYLKDGAVLCDDGKVVVPNIPEGSYFDENQTVILYIEGTGGKYETLQEALGELEKSVHSWEYLGFIPKVSIYCKPGADVGSLQHAPVISSLVIYGNNANVTGDGEHYFDLGNTDPNGGKDITSDIEFVVDGLNGCGVWGTKATEHTVDIKFTNCENMDKVWVDGTTGTLNIALTNCSFEGLLSEAVYSNANGSMTLDNVSFSNLNKAVNLNHKAAGEQVITIRNCTFTNCGNDVAADQIPVRVLSSVEGGTSTLTVDNCNFSGTPEGGADILLDYAEAGNSSVTISMTKANIVIEKKDPKYNAIVEIVGKSEESLTFTSDMHGDLVKECTIVDGEVEDFEFVCTSNVSQVETLTYTRTLVNMLWNPLYVPFKIPYEDLEENYEVAYINAMHSYDNDDNGEIDDMVMEIVKVKAGTLKPNHPYLIKAKNEEAKEMSIVQENATLYPAKITTLDCSSVYTKFEITGTYQKMTSEELNGSLVISTDGAWKKLSSTSTLKPFRFYLTISSREGSPVEIAEEAMSHVRIRVMGEEDNATGIDEVNTANDEQKSEIYDLYGRRVSAPAKGGVYIINGKKVIY